MVKDVSNERARKAELKEQQFKADRKTALNLKKKGMSNVAIANKMKKSESTIRILLK
jgi:DNA-binding NarL/FixJ family response regulator